MGAFPTSNFVSESGNRITRGVVDIQLVVLLFTFLIGIREVIFFSPNIMLLYANFAGRKMGILDWALKMYLPGVK